MEEIISKSRCTGCTACISICPRNAISMKENSEGFKMPVIDQEKCIDCDLCRRTCPVINTESNETLNKCYVAYSRSKSDLENSSSGGIFSVIANEILKENGIVIGAMLEKNKLKHIAITERKDLEKLKGSKYLQSDLGNIFKYIKDNIKQNKILFVATPCQVAGLRAFIKKDYDNLICIDLVCHGVPSPKLFEKYIRELESLNKKEIIDYKFRDKSTGWDNYSNSIIFKDKVVKELSSDNNYMKLFLSDVALRDSCYNCNFKLGNKYSDITLGDYWGVDKQHPEMYNEKGVSLIIINTLVGDKIFNKISKKLVYEQSDINKMLECNKSLQFSSKVSKDKRNKFFKDLENKKIDYLVRKYAGKPNIIIRIINKFFKTIKIKKH